MQGQKVKVPLGEGGEVGQKEWLWEVCHPWKICGNVIFLCPGQRDPPTAIAPVQSIWDREQDRATRFEGLHGPWTPPMGRAPSGGRGRSGGQGGGEGIGNKMQYHTFNVRLSK